MIDGFTWIRSIKYSKCHRQVKCSSFNFQYIYSQLQWFKSPDFMVLHWKIILNTPKLKYDHVSYNYTVYVKVTVKQNTYKLFSLYEHDIYGKFPDTTVDRYKLCGSCRFWHKAVIRNMLPLHPPTDWDFSRKAEMVNL